MARGYLSTILTAFWQIWFFPISSFQNKDFVNHFTTPLGFILFYICSWSFHWPINYDGFSEYDFDIIIWREKLALILHRRRWAEKGPHDHVQVHSMTLVAIVLSLESYSLIIWLILALLFTGWKIFKYLSLKLKSKMLQK